MSERDKCDLKTLLSYVPEERHKEVVDYVNSVIDDEAYRIDIDHDFLGFICDYIHYAELLQRTVDMTDALRQLKPSWKDQLEPLTVYDVGCATALQHLVFDPRIHYVGIDVGTSPEPRFFRPGCSFVRGRLPDIADQLGVRPQNAVGIANMSLFYLGSDEDWAAFDRLFRRKFVL